MLTPELFNHIISMQDTLRKEYQKRRAAYKLQKNREEKAREKLAKSMKLQNLI